MQSSSIWTTGKPYHLSYCIIYMTVNYTVCHWRFWLSAFTLKPLTFNLSVTSHLFAARTAFIISLYLFQVSVLCRKPLPVPLVQIPAHLHPWPQQLLFPRGSCQTARGESLLIGHTPVGPGFVFGPHYSQLNLIELIGAEVQFGSLPDCVTVPCITQTSPAAFCTSDCFNFH